ncbi:MAG: sodium:calcium antiporter [Candidatus Magasanikbacteria bacterium]
MSFILLIISLAIVIKSADFAIHYSTRLAESFRLSKYVVGFLIVAVISILPEMFIAVTSAIEGVPSFGLGMLFGSNVADLTLVFAMVVLIAGRSLKVESKIIKNRYLHIGIMSLPILFGLNGYYSRWEGLFLIVLGLAFYYYIFKNDAYDIDAPREKFKYTDLILLLISMGMLLLGSHFTVKFGVNFANYINFSPVLLGMFVVGLSTTLPELMFSVRAAKHNYDGLALGDILGTVVADATIIVGIIAIISPFAFNPQIVYVAGMFMLFGTVLLFHLMKTGKVLTKKEALSLIVFYLLFVSAELLINK